MGTWNYRVVKTSEGYSVYEVFYDEDGHPIGTTQNPTLDFYCDSPEDVLHELKVIKAAFDAPPISIEDIEDKQ